MADFTPKLYAAILQDMIDWAVAHTSKITDYNEGSTNHTILASVALVVEGLYFEVMLGWTDALRFALQNSLSFTKTAGAKATGNVVFSRAVAATQIYPIATGTVIATTDGTRFLTTGAGQISIGNTNSASIPIQAEEEGVAGNVAAAAISVLVSLPVGIETVTNAAQTTGGVTEETDDDYKIRFQTYLQGLTKTTPPGIEAGAEEVVGVAEGKVVETAILGIIDLYINDGSGSASSALLTSVQDKIEGDGTSSNPGYRAAGTLINYKSAVKVDITVNMTVDYEDSEDPVTLEPLVIAAVSGYINSLKIGQDVVLAEITDIVMNITGVADAQITLPTSNVEIDRTLGEIAKYLTGTYTMVLKIWD